jgi:hypothetical protein
MRACAKSGCDEAATASIGLRYEERVVVVGDLQLRYDPNLLELCGPHADRLTPPRGWVSEDRRDSGAASPEPAAAEVGAAPPAASDPAVPG